MKHCFPLLLFFVLNLSSVSGQTITKSVIASSGKSQVNNGIEIDWTLGQLSVAHLKQGSYLQAGFQNNNDEVILIDDDGIIQAKIFPNPFSDMLNIEIELVEDLQINIYNMYGQLIHKCPTEIANQIIDTRSWSVGTYIIAVEAPGNFKLTEKLIKHN